MEIIVPKSIKVGGHLYKISLNKDLIDSNDYGATNHRTSKIEINPARPEAQKACVLIHEILHVINHVYVNSDITEGQIESISEGLWQVADNFGIKLNWKDIT